MRFTEMFTGQKEMNSNTKQLGDLGVVGFNTGKTDKDVERTPHYEIQKSLEMYENIPLVSSGIEQMNLWLFPNEKVEIECKDAATKKFLEDWHEKRRGILEQYKLILQTNTICGTAPVETYRTTVKKSEDIGNAKPGKVLDNVYSFNDMSRIYINVNPQDNGSDAFIFELAKGTTHFTYRKEKKEAGWHYVSYIKNYQYFQHAVWGVTISSEDMMVYKSGWSRDNIYGRSPLASAIDAANVYNDIISSWDTIAKTRQLNQKLISLADNVDQSLRISNEKLQEIEEKLEEADKSYVLINTPLKIVQQDIDTAGGYDLMTGVFDIVRRLITMSLLPQHLTPWSDSATTQGSQAAMPPFMSRLKAKQNEFINWHKEHILDELIEKYDLKGTDAKLVIQEPKVMDDESYIRTISTLKRDEMIDDETAKKLLSKLGLF